MTVLRKFAVAMIALLLTVQGVNAVAMPLCEHGASGLNAPAGTQQTAGISHAHHEQDIGHDTGQPNLAPEIHDESNLACDDCEICALSCASTLPSAELAGATGTRCSARSSDDTLLIGVTPHQLSKPPLRA